MENILPRREARENAFLLAFSQTFGDIPLQEALDNHHECDEEHPVDVFGQRLLRAYYEHSAEVDDLKGFKQAGENASDSLVYFNGAHASADDEEHRFHGRKAGKVQSCKSIAAHQFTSDRRTGENRLSFREIG